MIVCSEDSLNSFNNIVVKPLMSLNSDRQQKPEVHFYTQCHRVWLLRRNEATTLAGSAIHRSFDNTTIPGVVLPY